MEQIFPNKMLLVTAIIALSGFFALQGTPAKTTHRASATMTCTSALDLFTENECDSVPIWVTYNAGCDVKGHKVAPNSSKSGVLGFDTSVSITITFPFGAETGTVDIYNNGSSNLITSIAITPAVTTYYYTLQSPASDAIWVRYHY